MKLLSIDTSTERASLAVVDGDHVLFERAYRSDRSHNSEIFAPLQEALGEHPDLEALLVGTGPGSYTGVRIGIAAATAVAMAHGLPLFSLSSMHAVAAGLPTVVVGDARRGQIFHGEVDPRVLRFQPVVHPTREQAMELITSLSDSRRLLVPLDEVSSELLPEASIADPPSAESLAAAFLSLSEEAREACVGEPPLPIYLQAPFTTTPKPRPS